ncbi:hypothetical protein L226DRAFT_572406 [Lentinus tigrinus ALCF2SS1-7]|uniref:DUF6533 domain-containing protein n=1 Tax=Lentinus tigrinus ALCF2SS1-6 TaxID=1328759 RepID=A0A5C2S5E8_9APHY|nr:hypothetical protein L227DRAFT_612370 [Lentinus tigrinus ALCF2SS1-6]RPD73333.1 hypothetical protein L226DRAFT_572406 [Lentinus tigrinus ALCF2SS1-7]
MSSGAGADAAALAALYNDLYTGTYCIMAASVLFIYDSIVTFNREVACFRTAKWTGAKCLFVINKGISVTIYVLELVSFASKFHSDELFLGHEDYESFFAGVADGSLGRILLSVLFILNTLHLTFILLSVAINTSRSTYITVFTGPLTAILMSRFLLQLQEASQVTVRVDSDDPLHMSLNGSEDTPSFVRSLGGVIDPDLPRDDVDDDEPEQDLQPHSESDGQEGEHASQAATSSSQA